VRLEKWLVETGHSVGDFRRLGSASIRYADRRVSVVKLIEVSDGSREATSVRLRPDRYSGRDDG
jgi:hypothetical protein